MSRKRPKQQKVKLDDRARLDTEIAETLAKIRALL